jgi:hypothetical protein
VPPGANALLEAVPFDGRTEAVTVVDGPFRFEGVAAGRHRVRLELGVPPTVRLSVEAREVHVPASGEVVVALEVVEDGR